MEPDNGSHWGDWLRANQGRFIVVEYFDGVTVSGVLKGFGYGSLSLESVQKVDGERVPVLASFHRVRVIRRKHLREQEPRTVVALPEGLANLDAAD